MSYGRNPHYIWSNGEVLHFEPYGAISENLINAFLYKILLTTYRDDLAERLQQGRQEWMTQHKVIDEKDDKGNLINFRIEEVPQDEFYVKWMEDNEDELLKTLMGK